MMYIQKKIILGEIVKIKRNRTVIPYITVFWLKKSNFYHRSRIRKLLRTEGVIGRARSNLRMPKYVYCNE